MTEVTSDTRPALDRLRRARRVLIVSHRSPDGDAVGSSLAAAEIAEALGVAAEIVHGDPAPVNLRFLPGIERIALADALPDGFETRFDLALVLECPGLDRTGFDGLDRLPIVNLDHHLANDAYGEVNVVDPEAPAVGEMLLTMATAAGLTVTPAMATNLYAALVTDTGDFRYSNATPRAFAAAGQLVAAGAEPARIADALWDHQPARVVRLTAAVLATLELAFDGALALLHCDTDMLGAAGAGPEDTENLINHVRSIEGVEVAVLLKAFVPGRVRVSLRSRRDVDVQRVAARFGGGGHRNAAGCTLDGDLAGARSALLEALGPLLETR